MIERKFFLGLLMCFFMACQSEEAVTPKPRMYPKINFPTQNYTTFQSVGCPLQFEFPAHARIVKDSSFYEKSLPGECWFDLRMDTLNASLHCSYLPIRGQGELSNLINDAFDLAGKHNIKANARRESVISNANGAGGLFFEIDGPVATPIQFFLTDSTKHFFRASLYFNAKVNPDSTAPVLQFVRKDIEKMLETFSWSPK